MQENTLKIHENFLVENTIAVDELVISDAAVLSVPVGKQLTLTVDGIHKDILPGTYRGNIILSVTDSIQVEYSTHGDVSIFEMNAAVAVHDGHYIPQQSVSAAVLEGEITAGGCRGIKLRSEGDNLGGIYLSGSGTYTIDHADIEMIGNGGSDAVGYGAAICVRGEAKAIINHAEIHNIGSIRTAIQVCEHGQAEVNDSRLSCKDGNKPNYVFAMSKAPWMLGIHGRVRTTNIQDYGCVTYNRCHITAENWGVMSTDGTKCVRLYMNDCIIETENCGYGAYSIGDCLDSFRHCIIRSHDYGVIQCSSGRVTFTEGTEVHAGRNAVMLHSSGEPGLLLVEDGSSLHSKEAVFLAKSRGSDILVDGAALNSDSGILYLTMINDDLNTRGVHLGPETVMEPPPGGFPPRPAPPAQEGMDERPAGPPPVETPTPAKAVFRNTTLTGDFLHGASAVQDMELTFENTTLSGVIATCTTSHPSGIAQCAEQYALVGRVEAWPCPNDDDFGISVNLGSGAQWNVTGKSYLRQLTIAEDSTINAKSMSVNGIATVIAPGSYAGQIVLE